MPDEPTLGEVQRDVNRIHKRLDSFSAVTPEVFAAEIRLQGEIHERHRDAINKLFEQIDINRKLQEQGDKDLRGWMQWLFALLLMNLATLVGIIVTAVVTLL